MGELKGQFMIISAVLVSILLMSTATTMSEIRESNYSPSQRDYHINSIEQLGEKLDLAKKHDRQKFRESLDYITSYSIETTFWDEKKCYNITLSNPNTEISTTCAGNGSIFHDSFEDGEHTDPLWIKTGQDGEMQVNTEYSPANGKKALTLQENGQNSTSFTADLQQNFNAWEQSWTARGLYKTETLDKTTSQKHELILNANQNHDDQIHVQLGISNHAGNNLDFRIKDEGLIDSPDGTPVNWQEDTWYSWEIIHDGSGNYDGRIWEYSDGRPSNADVQASGVTSSEIGSISYRINGTAGRGFRVAHDYVKLEN